MIRIKWGKYIISDTIRGPPGQPAECSSGLRTAGLAEQCPGASSTKHWRYLAALATRDGGRQGWRTGGCASLPAVSCRTLKRDAYAERTSAPKSPLGWVAGIQVGTTIQVTRQDVLYPMSTSQSQAEGIRAYVSTRVRLPVEPYLDGGGASARTCPQMQPSAQTMNTAAATCILRNTCIP
eukprot:scaffold683_cov423-Prasinococcus_capsulatus_cf.AAC.9